MKKKLSTIFLLGITGFLIFSLIYISILLRQQGNNSATTVKKTKAAAHSYTRFLALNTISPTPENTGQSGNSPTPTGTGGLNVTVTPSITETSGNPTPTEILLANKNLSPGMSITPDLTITLEPSPTLTEAEASLSGTIVQPTKTNKLPTTGWVGYPLTIFGIASAIVFISFLF